MTPRRRNAAVRATDVAEAYAVGWATMTTLTYRLPMIWLSMFSPNGSRQHEEVRMISEKVVAAYEGAWAGQMALANALWSPATMMKAPFASNWRHPPRHNCARPPQGEGERPAVAASQAPLAGDVECVIAPE